MTTDVIRVQKVRAQLTRDHVWAWVLETTGWWDYKVMDTELDIRSKTGKATRRQIVHRLIEDGLLHRHPEKDGLFRRVDNEARKLDWMSADVDNTLPLQWPFGLEELVRFYPKNIAIIAGSPNAGKSAFCFDFIRRNMGAFEVDYYTSEMGPEELKVRLSKFEMPLEEWRFEPFERSGGFADVLHPDRVSVIDFLEVTNDFYRVSEELTEIHQKLNKGFALVALQKKIGSTLGRGAEFSLEKPRLYLSMEAGKLKIVKAKNWADGRVNPNNKKWRFQLVGGCKFVNVKEDITNEFGDF